MITTDKSLKAALEPFVLIKLAEYEKRYTLNDEERAAVKLVLASLSICGRVRRQEQMFQLINVSPNQRN